MADVQNNTPNLLDEPLGMIADAIDPDHEHDCPMQSPAPNAICNCGNPKAIKWDAQGCRFWSPHYDTPQTGGER